MSIFGAALVTGATIGVLGADAGAGATGTGTVVAPPVAGVRTGTGGAGTAVTFQVAGSLTLPAESLAVTVIVCGPSARTRSSGEPQPNAAPASTWQVYATGVLSRAVNSSRSLPPTAILAVRVTIASSGFVSSMVKPTCSATPKSAALSVVPFAARTVSECAPSPSESVS